MNISLCKLANRYSPFLFTIIFCLLSGVVLFSCKKTDFCNQKTIDIKERFFELPENSPTYLQRIISNMKMQDDQNPFAVSFVRNQGYPMWNHIKVSVLHPAYNSVEPESDTLVSVPIVEEGTNYIKSVLAIKVNSEVWYKLLEGNRYRELPPEDPNDPGEPFTVMDFLKLMMELETEMFGYNEFEIIDEEIIAQSNISYPGGSGIRYGSQISFSGGCTTFKWGHYELTGFIIDGSEEVCLYETGELLYSLNPPLTEPGGGGAGSGGGPSGPSQEECRRGFIRVIVIDNNGNPITPCELVPDVFDSIPSLLSRVADRALDSLYQWGMDHGFREQSGILVKKNGQIYAKNFQPGTLSGDKAKVNYSLAPGEELIAYVHTHAEDTSSDFRTSFSPEDLIEFNTNAFINGYTALVEVGNARYAFVLEDVTKKRAFNISKRGNHRKYFYEIFDNLQIANGQIRTEEAWVQYLGSATASGIGIYKATEPNKNNFTKLNP